MRGVFYFSTTRSYFLRGVFYIFCQTFYISLGVFYISCATLCILLCVFYISGKTFYRVGPPSPTPCKTYPKPLISALPGLWRPSGQISGFWATLADPLQNLSKTIDFGSPWPLAAIWPDFGILGPYFGILGHPRRPLTKPIQNN